MNGQCDRRIIERKIPRAGFGVRTCRLCIGVGLIAVVLGINCALVYREELTRAYDVVRLFDADRIQRNFRSMDTLFSTTRVSRGTSAHQFARDPRDLPATYVYDGKTKDLSAFLESTWTTGLIVVKDGNIASEQYFRGNTDASKAIAWSVSKSIVSALVGIAVAEGRIDVNAAVSDYVPVLRGSAYDGVPVKDVLQMASGVRFSEDYGDFFSDINRLGRAIALNTPMEKFITSLERERPSGTGHHYMSMDTQVLGMVVRAATGESLASYLESRIWRRIGMESDAYWLVDRSGIELAFGGLNGVLRDYARLGQLYLNEGHWDGKQIIPRAWIVASVTPSMLGIGPESGSSRWAQGYGYQWWIPSASEGDYVAVGHSNQFIYVHPQEGIVIAKTSAYPRYTIDGDEKERETIAVFRAIAGHLAPAGGSDRSVTP